MAGLQGEAANFGRAAIANTDFSNARLVSADFTSANTGFDDNGAIVAAPNFFQAELRDARFDQASLLGANFSEAQGEHASFNNAFLAGSSMTEAR